jgi:mono/diheme cytochrome c family protein
MVMIKKLRPIWTPGLATLGALTLFASQGAPGASGVDVHRAEALTGAAAEQFARGEALYRTHCSGCHQLNGQGLAGAFPPLAGSDYLLADRRRAIETVVLGRSGPITVNGVGYNGVMPGMGYLADPDVADIVSVYRTRPQR